MLITKISTYWLKNNKTQVRLPKTAFAQISSSVWGKGEGKKGEVEEGADDKSKLVLLQYRDKQEYRLL